MILEEETRLRVLRWSVWTDGGSCSSTSDAAHNSSESSSKRQYSLNLSCKSIPNWWTCNTVMSSVTSWPHPSNSYTVSLSATSSSASPCFHFAQAAATVLSLYRFIRATFWTQLWRSYRPPPLPVTGEGGRFILLQTCFQHNITGVSDWSAKPQWTTHFYINNKIQPHGTSFIYR